jgi:hypothetical protein
MIISRGKRKKPGEKLAAMPLLPPQIVTEILPRPQERSERSEPNLMGCDMTNSPDVLLNSQAL